VGKNIAIMDVPLDIIPDTHIGAKSHTPSLSIQVDGSVKDTQESIMSSK
jgi:hypothetical protein